MGAGSAAIVLGGRGSDAARIRHPRSRLRYHADARQGGQYPAPHGRDGDWRGKGPRRQEYARAVSVITGLDHVVVLVRDINVASAAYQTLLARAPSWQYSCGGADRVLFTLDNTTIELVAPSGEDDNAQRIRSILDAQGEGLASICFRTDDIAKMHRRLDRLTLKPEPVADVESRDAVSNDTMSWKRTRTATETTRGVRLRGLCWRVADIDATHARRAQAGVDVSEVRTGRKPGTRVMTVRSGTCGVPTLLVQPSAGPPTAAD